VIGPNFKGSVTSTQNLFPSAPNPSASANNLYSHTVATANKITKKVTKTETEDFSGAIE